MYTGKAINCSTGSGSGSSSGGTYNDLNIDLKGYDLSVTMKADQFCLDRLKQICEYHLQSASSRNRDELLDCAKCATQSIASYLSAPQKKCGLLERSRYNTLPAKKAKKVNMTPG